MRISPLGCLNLSLFCQILTAGLGKKAALVMPEYTLLSVASNGWYLASLLCLVVQSLVWPLVLRHYPLTFACFYMSLNYGGVLLVSRIVFNESIGTFNLLGAILIFLGVNLLTGRKWPLSRD